METFPATFGKLKLSGEVAGHADTTLNPRPGETKGTGRGEKKEEKPLTTTVIEWLRQFPILPGSVLKLGDVEWLLQDSAHEWREPDSEGRILF